MAKLSDFVSIETQPDGSVKLVLTKKAVEGDYQVYGGGDITLEPWELDAKSPEIKLEAQEFEIDVVNDIGTLVAEGKIKLTHKLEITEDPEFEDDEDE